MADRPTTSRVGRLTARSAHQIPKGTAKVGRPRSKSVQKPKTRGSAKKDTNPAKETSKVNSSIKVRHCRSRSGIFRRSVTRSSSLRFIAGK